MAIAAIALDQHATRVIFGLLLAYLLGSIPFGLLLYRLVKRGDLRGTGSGNIGATNVTRTAGLTLGIATLLLDAAKGYLGVAVALRLTNRSFAIMALAAFAAVLGHACSVFIAFRGGKGVSTALGAYLALAPAAILCSLIIFSIAYGLRRYVSLASIAAVAVFPLAVLLLEPKQLTLFASALLSSSLIIYRHKSNILRLREGSEPALQLPPRREQR